MGGTTLAALSGDDGVRIGFSIAIEGYSKVLTDHPTATTLSNIGWNGVGDFTGVLTGLEVPGNELEQSIEPWQVDLKANGFTFRVRNETLSALMFASAAGNQTTMTADIDANDTTISATDTSSFASSGDIYLGTETITYSGKTATSFTGCTRGVYHPFSTESGTANRIGRDHKFTSLGDGVYFKPLVTDAPRHWKGRWVGVWMHRITSSQTWDTKANAQLLFAGKIVEYEDAENGDLIIHCRDLRDTIKRTTVLHDQWRAKLTDKIWLAAGMEFYLREYGTSATNTTDALVVVSSGASGTAQVNEGQYSVAELISKLNRWLYGEYNGSNVAAIWGFLVVSGNDGERVKLRTLSSSTSYQTVGFACPIEVMGSLGFQIDQRTSGVFSSDELAFISKTQGSYPISIIAPDAPSEGGFVGISDAPAIINVTGAVGSLVDVTTSMPALWQQWITAGDTWALLQIGSSIVALAKQVSATRYELHQRRTLTALLGGRVDKNSAEKVGSPLDGEIEVKQILVMEKTFKAALMEFVTSTGVAAYNDDDNDVLPAQCGAAIPHELVSGLEASADSASDGNLLIVIEKPTKLEDIMVPELLLRACNLIWKNGGLIVVQHPSPTSGLAVHSLTESNKAGQRGDHQRTATQSTDEFLVNVLKIDYNRSPLLAGQSYLDTRTYKFARSISEFGESRPFTIKARNSYTGNTPTGSTVEAAARKLVSDVLPLYGEPLYRLRRTVSQNYFENVAPGDIVTVTDNFARDPDTGARGITGKPGLIISHRYNWGGQGQPPFGEVDILFVPFDNVALYSPAAWVDETATSAGYEAGKDIDGNASATSVRMTFRANEFTEASGAQATTDLAFFAADDKVRIYEVDDAGGSAQTWTGTIVAIDGANRRVEINTGTGSMTGFDTTGATAYVMVSQQYSDATATQKANAYVADDADELVQNSRVAFEFGRHSNSVFSASPSTQLYAQMGVLTGAVNPFSEGQPMSTFLHANAARFVNNFIDYRSALHQPVMFDQSTGYINGGEVAAPGTLLYVAPYYFGKVDLPANVSRFLTVRAITQLGSGTGGSFRVYISASPPYGTSTTDFGFPDPFQYITFSATDASVTAQTANTLLFRGLWRRGFGYLSIVGIGDTGDVGRLYCLSEVSLGPRQ